MDGWKKSDMLKESLKEGVEAELLLEVRFEREGDGVRSLELGQPYIREGDASPGWV